MPAPVWPSSRSRSSRSCSCSCSRRGPYLAQRRQVSTAQHDVDVLREQNDELQAKAAELEKPAEIERMGREQFHLVFPGETAYIVSPGEPTPSGTSTTTLP